MGGGASKQGAPAVSEAGMENGTHVESHSSEGDDEIRRSPVWTKAYKALSEYKPLELVNFEPEDDDSEPDDPEDECVLKVEDAITENVNEARTAMAPITGRSLLHVAAAKGALRCEMAPRLLSLSPMFHFRFCPQGMRTLLDAGAHPDLQDKYGDTALHWAAHDGQFDATTLLVNSGASTTVHNKHDKNAMGWALAFGFTDIAQVIKKAGGSKVKLRELPRDVTPELLEELDLTEKQVRVFLEAFMVFDSDGSGTIDSDELGDVIRAAGFQPSEAETADMMDEADEDGSGALDFIGESATPLLFAPAAFQFWLRRIFGPCRSTNRRRSKPAR